MFCCVYLLSGDVPHISSLHIVDMDLFVGLLNGKLLMVDLITMSPIAVFHCHEDRVKPIFSLKVILSVCICGVCVCVHAYVRACADRSRYT